MALDQRIAHALLDRRDELPRNRPPDDLIDKLETTATLKRLDLQPAIAVLAASAGLTFVLTLRLGAPFDRFFIGYLRCVELDLDVKLTLQLFDGDLDMHLTGAREDNLVGLWIAMGLKCGILFEQACERLRSFLFIPARLGPNRE